VDSLRSEIDAVVSRALVEDVGLGDPTAEAIVPPGTRARARIDQKQRGVIYGLDAAEAVFKRLDALVDWRPQAAEGEWRKQEGLPVTIVELAGDARALLTGERTALNLLAHLSGVATLTASFVYALRGTGVEVLDTRKTTPGLRALEKRAVAAGGGRNHRMGLYDAMLVKDNHIALAGGVAEATRRALARRPPDCPLTVECRTVDEVEEAIGAGADRLLLDNMTPDQLRQAVERARGRAVLEASGGVTLETVRSIAEPGLQWVSVGAITHSAPALDLSMTIESA
jgi:nicotinate-nucleotide pyrophosphorylase (carboxylating)